MARATQLAQSTNDHLINLNTIDTQGRPERTAEAAGMAVETGAQLILGPVFGSEVPSALEAIRGRVPLVTFSNDATLVDQGALVFGITPAQSVSAILRYARGRGIQRFAVVAQSGDLGRQSVDAANRIATESGLELTSIVYLDGNVDRVTLLGDLRADGNGRLPDAILLPGGGDSLSALAGLFDGTGMQLLGTVQWSSQNLVQIPALRNAWFAAPDPRTFSVFDEAYQGNYRENPGILAGLAFDAVTMAQNLALNGRLDRSGITSSSGFSGVVGDFRFMTNGDCRRDMAILAVSASGTVTVVDKIAA